jgi:predicted patatin/cPLA2 family phospholipase
MYDDLVALLEANRHRLIAKRVEADLLGPYPNMVVERLENAYHRIINSLIEYLTTSNVPEYVKRVEDMARRYIEGGISIETMLKTGTNMRNECILLVEETYKDNPATCDKFVRKIKSLQALSFSILTTVGMKQ